MLNKNVQVNNYENVILTNKAVSDKNEKCLLYVGQESSGANRIYEPKKSSPYNQKFETVTTETIVLDDFLKNEENLDKISFIKMDMEGSELKGLHGMSSIIHSDKPLTILTELSWASVKDSGSTVTDYLNFFKNENFSIHVVDDLNEKIIPVTVDEYMKSKFKNKTTNLLCKRI